jgi:hypothetical protein
MRWLRISLPLVALPALLALSGCRMTPENAGEVEDVGNLAARRQTPEQDHSSTIAVGQRPEPRPGAGAMGDGAGTEGGPGMGNDVQTATAGPKTGSGTQTGE